MGGFATSGTILAVSAGSDEWTTKAYSAIGVCAVIVAGAILLLGRIDKAWMERRKAWEEFNKSSITQQLEQSNDHIVKMRHTLQEMVNTSNASHMENISLRDDLSTLRSQFIDVARNLHEAEVDLHDANVSLRKTLNEVHEIQEQLRISENDRILLHQQIAVLQALSVRVDDNQTRLQKIEDSGDYPPVS